MLIINREVIQAKGSLLDKSQIVNQGFTKYTSSYNNTCLLLIGSGYVSSFC